MNKPKPTYDVFRRFYAWKLPFSLGMTLAITGGFVLVITVLAMLQDTSTFLFVASIPLALASAAMLVVGILSILASVETVRVSPEGIRLCLFGLTLLRLPAANIRSAVATTREYRQRLTDRQIYLVRVYRHRGFLPSLALWLQWSGDIEAAFRRNLPAVDLLL